jgi:hypothetical protein
MTEQKPADNATLDDRLGRIERLATELVGKLAGLVGKNTSLVHSDLFVIGAVRRTLAQSQGFRDLIKAKNFPCAAAILRMQLDTAMRVNALRIVEERNQFCEEILKGKRFTSLKDSSGVKLTDAHLRKKLAEEHPWIGPIYEQTSDFIHLSGRHFYSSILRMDDDTRIVTFEISGTDPPQSEDRYFEIVDEFFAISKIVSVMLLGYFTARSGVLDKSEPETSEP